MSTKRGQYPLQDQLQNEQRSDKVYTNSNGDARKSNVCLENRGEGPVPKVSPQPYQNSGIKIESTNQRPNNDSDSIDDNESIHLNAYSIYPTTIPPFALDQEFQKVKANNALFNDALIPEVSHAQYRGTDQFLSYENSKWENFVSIIGSNVAYTTDTRINLAPKSRLSRPQSIEFHNDVSSITPEEAELIRKEVLTDLSGKWSGDERLKALDNIPIGGDYKFKNEKDKKDWMDYVSRVKRLYYGRGLLGNKINSEGEALNHTDCGERRPSDVSWSTIGRPAEWMDDLSKERERWRQLKKKKDAEVEAKTISSVNR